MQPHEGLLTLPSWNKDQIKQVLPMYSDATLYVDGMRFLDGMHGFGYLTVLDKHTKRHFSPEELKLKAYNFSTRSASFALMIRDEHVQGHFTPETGILILPGHKQLAAAIQAFEAALSETKRMEPNSRLGIKTIYGPLTFKQPIFPGDQIEIVTEQIQDFGADIWGSAHILLRHLEATTIEDVVLTLQRKIEAQKDEGITQDRILEAVAQALGCLYLRGQESKDLTPVFQSVETIDFNAAEVLPGQTMEIELEIKNERLDGFEGDAIAKVDGIEIGTITRINCALVDRARLVRVLTALRKRRQKDYE